MAATEIDFEDGTDGDTLAAGDSGSSVITTTGGTVKYDADAAVHGSLGLTITRTSTSSSCYGEWHLDAANDQSAWRFYFRFPGAVPAATIELFRLLSATDTNVSYLQYRTDGSMRWYDNSSSYTAVTETFAADIRYCAAITVDRSTGSGTLNFYPGDSDTPINSTPYSVSGKDFGSAPILGCRVGIPSGGAVGDTVQIDDLAYEGGATAEIGPIATPGDTVVNADFEDGSADGTLGNGDSGCQYTAVSGGTITYRTAAAMHGSLGAEFARTASSGSIYAAWVPEDADGELAVRIGVKLPALPQNTITILRGVTATDTSAMLLQIAATGAVQMKDANNANTVTVGANLTPLTAYTIKLVLDTVTGAYTINVYEGDGGTPINATCTGTGYALGSDAWTEYRVGITDGGLVGDTIYVDDFAYEVGATAEIGPVGGASNDSPTADAGQAQTGIEPWSTVTLDGTGSTDSDGTIASYAWTQLAGTTVTLDDDTAARPTFTAPGTLDGETLQFQLTVTDDDGATASDFVNVTILPVTDTIVIGGQQVPLQILLVTA